LFFELLTRGHNRKDFDCGVNSINTYLKKYARQNKRLNISQPYVLTDSAGTIFGFYTLNAAEIHIDSLPSRFTEKLPRYPVPVIKIGQLGVDKGHRGKGIGKTLLINALERSYHTSESIGAYAVTVDAINETAVAFYKHFGFQSFPDTSDRLFMPMKEIGML